MKWSVSRLFKGKDECETGPEAVKPKPVEGAEKPQEVAAAEEGNRKGWLSKLKSGLRKTHDRISTSLKSVLRAGRKLDDETIEEVEEILYSADIGPRAVLRLSESLRTAYRERVITDSGDVMDFLKNEIKNDLRQWDLSLNMAESGPTVIMVAGVNGSGKTTSIAKLAHMFVQQGKSVLLAASDTFRAAAVEQLAIWSERAGADMVRNDAGDPAAVAYDAAERAVARGYDILIVDTAGRLHTRKNLMQELGKIRRVLRKKIPDAPHEMLIVLDAVTGQNAIKQAITFNESIELTGIVLAKLDGTAKGGVVFGMREQIDIPVKFIGVGETMVDIAPFDPEKFVDAIFE